MKLNSLKIILDKVIPNLESTRQSAQRGNANFILYSNVNELREAISLIEKTGLFKEVITNLINSELYKISSDSLYIEPAQSKSIEENLSRLLTLCLEFYDLLGVIIGEVDAYTVNVHLPFIKDFEDLASASKDLQTILAQVVINKEVNGNVNIVSVENGSIWIAVSLGSLIAVNLIGRIVNVALHIQSKIYYNRILESKAKLVKMATDRQQYLIEQEEKLVSLYVEIESEIIKKEFFKNPDGDIGERIKNSIRLFTSMIDKGAEIIPALSVPDESKATFPNEQFLNAFKEQFNLKDGQKNISNDKTI